LESGSSPRTNLPRLRRPGRSKATNRGHPADGTADHIVTLESQGYNTVQATIIALGDQAGGLLDLDRLQNAIEGRDRDGNDLTLAARAYDGVVWAAEISVLGTGGLLIRDAAKAKAKAATAPKPTKPAATATAPQETTPRPKTNAPAARTARLTTRAEEVHTVLHPIARNHRTTAVLETSGGDIIGGGKIDLTPAQRAALRPGEIAARLPGEHAEITALQEAARRELRPRAISTTRDFCLDCRRALEEAGARITGPRTAVWD
jgi:hypothetical protein